jgi:hypothetical protein
MSNPADVLQQLNTALFTRQIANDTKVDIHEDHLDEDQASKRFLGHYLRRGQGEYRTGDRSDDVKDVDTLQAGDVDDDYVTNRAGVLPYDTFQTYNPNKIGFESFIHKLRDMMEQAAMSPEEVGAAAAGGDPTGGAIDTPEEMQAQQAGQQVPQQPISGMPPEQLPPEAMEAGLGQPLPMEDVSKTPTDLGRIYELKKIYTRLTVIESYLTESSDPSMIELRTIVSKSIELFEVLASNFSSFKPPRAPEETLDEIIIQYYRFLEKVYTETASYYRKRAKEHNSNELDPIEAPTMKINVYNP